MQCGEQHTCLSSRASRARARAPALARQQCAVCARRTCSVMLLAAEAAVPDQSNVEDMRYLNDPSIMPGKACARPLLHTSHTHTHSTHTYTRIQVPVVQYIGVYLHNFLYYLHMCGSSLSRYVVNMLRQLSLCTSILVR